jgi:hypothetical protein
MQTKGGEVQLAPKGVAELYANGDAGVVAKDI